MLFQGQPRKSLQDPMSNKQQKQKQKQNKTKTGHGVVPVIPGTQNT
jgi:hypothetical protein